MSVVKQDRQPDTATVRSRQRIKRALLVEDLEPQSGMINGIAVFKGFILSVLFKTADIMKQGSHPGQKSRPGPELFMFSQEPGLLCHSQGVIYFQFDIGVIYID